ncbi:MAG: SCO family protein [Planctomycetota bacterium]|nr:SCO family protein [Planctomycetota bacterium]
MKFSTALYILAIATLAVFRAPSTSAQVPAPPIPVDVKQSILEKVGIDQNLGIVVPLNLAFKDESGGDVKLGDYFGKRPVVLALVYFQCPMLCTMVLNDLLRTVKAMPENLGMDFDIVTVSFDPADTPQLATLKKETYLAQYNRPGAEAGWHFLTGQQDSITALTQSVGFRYAWDSKFNVFAHASGIMVLTPDGKISRYFFGIDYAPKDLRISLTEASNGKTGGLADAVLMFCFHYDPATGKYGLAIDRALKAGGILTLIVMGSFIALMLRRDKHALAMPQSEQTADATSPEVRHP